MNITKIGHCCLVIEEKGTRLMTDPGQYSSGHGDYADIDAILITHEHSDHCHIDALGPIVEKNPGVQIYCNSAVAPLLDEMGISYILVADQESFTVKNLAIEAHEYDHEEIHPIVETVRNTGFLIDHRFYYGGDALQAPDTPIDVLAVPVAGPWMRLRNGIDFALHVKPKKAFPVHDGILTNQHGVWQILPGKVLGGEGIEWSMLEPGETKTF